MTLFRTVEPAVEPVSAAEAKAHLRIDHDSEDALLSGLIRAAREEVERSTGLALIAQSWRLTLDDWPCDGLVLLRRTPVRGLLSVTVFDGDGAASVIPAERWTLDLNASPARLALAGLPAPGARLNGIEIDFTAGFGESEADVPDLLKRALLILVAHWYEFRGAFDADAQPVSVPDTYRRLIAAYRAPRL